MRKYRKCLKRVNLCNAVTILTFEVVYLPVSLGWFIWFNFEIQYHMVHMWRELLDSFQVHHCQVPTPRCVQQLLNLLACLGDPLFPTGIGYVTTECHSIIVRGNFSGVSFSPDIAVNKEDSSSFTLQCLDSDMVTHGRAGDQAQIDDIGHILGTCLSVVPLRKKDPVLYRNFINNSVGVPVKWCNELGQYC